MLFRPAVRALIVVATFVTCLGDAAQVDEEVSLHASSFDTAGVGEAGLSLAGTGAVVSEGVVSTNAAALHAAGWTGVGAHVAVFDRGFNGKATLIAAGELPADVAEHSFCGGSNSSHGSAVAEIVYDMAPDADITLVCTDSVYDLDDAVTLVNGLGVDIIVSSTQWFHDSPGDGSAGAAEDAVDLANTNGILWINSAGNNAQDHWTGQAENDGNFWVDFGGAQINRVVGGLAPGETVHVFARWDDWPLSDQDFDLHLFEMTPDPASLDDGDRIQDGTKPPAEIVSYTNNTGATKDIGVAVATGNVTAAHRMDVWAFVVESASSLTHSVAASSVSDPATSPGVFAVGAVDTSGSGNLSANSSRGPTIDDRVKPDIVAPAGVSVATTGYSPFTGTSAAAPHVAGMAALMLDAQAHLTDNDLKGLLERFAVDFGQEGKDNAYGVGELYVELPPNDDFADAELLPSQFENFIATSNLYATDEPGEPHGGPLGGCDGHLQRALWYRYVPDYNSALTFTTTGAFYGTDTVLAAYAGTSFGDLVEIACNDDTSGGDTDSILEFYGAAGNPIWIQVGGYDGEMGTFSLNIFEDSAVSDLSVAIVRVSDGLTVEAGEEVTWQMRLTNDGPDAADVIGSLQIPSGFTYVSHAGPGHYFAGDGTWDVGAVDPGETAVLAVTTTAKLGDYTITAEVLDSTSWDPDSTPGNGDNDEDDYDHWNETVFEGDDAEPPMWPAASSIWTTSVQSDRIAVAWSAAEDDVGVVDYAVYLDHLLVGTTGGARSFVLADLAPGIRYHISVEAADQAGHWTNGEGPGVYATTLPEGDYDPFWDDDGLIFESDIEWLAAAGITSGCNPPVNDMFCPASYVTRGQMAAFLTRALVLADRLADPFWDDDGLVFEADIERLAAAGITAGCNPPTNDMYCPHSYVTRAQMAAFLRRALE